MKKLSVCITCIIALVLGVSGSAYSESGKSKKQGNSEGRGILYQFEDYASCVAGVHGNGFFSIRARGTLDSSYTGTFRRVCAITLGKTRDGAMFVSGSYSLVTVYFNDPKEIKGYDGYDIRGARCVEYAKEFPIEMHYGIGSE